MLNDLRIYDIGYFGPAHTNIGIVIGIHPKNETITLLDITDPKNRKETSIHFETFVPTKNISDLVAAVNTTAAANTTTTSASNAKIQVVRKAPVNDGKDLIKLLYTAKQDYDGRDTADRREQTLVELQRVIAEGPNSTSLNEVRMVINSNVDIINRILTIIPDQPESTVFKRIWVLRISMINKELIVHEASIRYDSARKTTRPLVTANSYPTANLTPNHSPGVSVQQC